MVGTAFVEPKRMIVAQQHNVVITWAPPSHHCYIVAFNTVVHFLFQILTYFKIVTNHLPACDKTCFNMDFSFKFLTSVGVVIRVVSQPLLVVGSSQS